MLLTRSRTPTGIVLENITWRTYERLLREVGERPIRMTYDNGDLEIMAMSFGHEHTKRFIGRMVDTLTLELEIPMQSGGSTTLRRKLKKKGLEADECYWIANAKAMDGKKEFEPEIDPPPDLAVEVDITSSCMDRMRIYAALKIPEIWRYHRRRLRVHLLVDGDYEEAEQSSVFPFLPVHELNRFIDLSERENETAAMGAFLAWLRKDIVPAYKNFQTKSAGNGRKNGKNGAAKSGK